MKKIVAGLLVLAFLIAAFFTLRQPRPENTTIKIGYLAIGAGLPLFVANDQGFFTEYGLNVDLIEFKSSNDVASAAIASRIDLIGTGATNAMLDANSQTNAQFKMFMVNNYVKRPNNQSTDFVLIRKDSTISSFADLSGKTVAIFPGSVGEVFAKAVMPKLGIQRSEVNAVPMAPPQWLPALETGSVDAIVGAVEPFATMMLETGKFKILINGYYGELLASVPASGSWFVGDRIDRDTEEKVARVFEKAIKFIDENPTEARSALLNYTSIPKEIIPTIRLQDWRMTSNENTRLHSLELAEDFFELGGISSMPEDDGWLWK